MKTEPANNQNFLEIVNNLMVGLTIVLLLAFMGYSFLLIPPTIDNELDANFSIWTSNLPRDYSYDVYPS
ncbi:MAG: hypothetical protein COA71_00035 [SAR86 cluster bacterium]|uniref:Uncharacterized protein n=1 Tax=SAR86 cluster bacterium TaxID=2030880 RepID=A0A2A5CIV9_9GAMM|nr:MAG: hypothetical protein COA71_00035 [SAR86 cluster bacterium]